MRERAPAIHKTSRQTLIVRRRTLVFMAHSRERFSAGVRRILQVRQRAKGKEQLRRLKIENYKLQIETERGCAAQLRLEIKLSCGNLQFSFCNLQFSLFGLVALCPW